MCTRSASTETETAGPAARDPDQLELPFEKCGACGKSITTDEYVVNWGSCGPCFDADYLAYLASEETNDRTDQHTEDAEVFPFA